MGRKDDSGAQTETARENENDLLHFIKKSSVTSDDEISEKTLYELDMERIEEEAEYDDIHAIVTNLEGNVKQILKINKRKWEIEGNFQIMKSEQHYKENKHQKQKEEI